MEMVLQIGEGKSWTFLRVRMVGNEDWSERTRCKRDKNLKYVSLGVPITDAKPPSRPSSAIVL